MPSKSIRSTGTSKTVRTVDDVFSVLEDELDRSASLADSKRAIDRHTLGNAKLNKDAVNELYNPATILAPTTSNTSMLLKLMFNHKVVLGGIQATSFFYPLCDLSDAPWDFFCCNRYDSDAFITSVKQSCGMDMIEELSSDNGVRVVYFRRNANGVSKPINIRVYISDDEPLQMVLSQPMSYQQSFVSAVGAVCFWPRLNSKGLCRQFEKNVSKFNFPSGKSKLTINMKKMSRTKPKNPSSGVSIYTAGDDRTETICFENVCKLDKVLFKKEIKKIQSIAYAVSEKSSRYLGEYSDM